MIASVILDIKNNQCNKTFDYLVPSKFEGVIKEGVRVFVPFGKRRLLGIVTELKDDSSYNEKLREIIELIDIEPILDKELLEFFKKMGAIRKEQPFMEEADLKVHNININYLAFERINEEEKTFVVINRTPQEQLFIIPDEYKQSDTVYTLKKSKPGSLGPYGAIAIKK